MATKTAPAKKTTTTAHKSLLNFKVIPDCDMLAMSLGISEERCDYIDTKVEQWAKETDTYKATMADKANKELSDGAELVFALIRIGEA